MKNALCAALLVALVVSRGYGQIVVPENVKVGDYVVVEANTNENTQVGWTIYSPWDKQFDTFENNRILVTSAGLQPGEIRGEAILIDFEAKTFSQKRFIITISGDTPTPPVPPIPPPTPENPFGLKEIARDAVAKVPAAYQKLAPIIAKEIRVAVQIDAKAPQDLINAVKSAQKKALGNYYNTWEDWANSVNVVLEQHEAELQDVKTLRSAYLAICIGLEGTNVSTRTTGTKNTATQGTNGRGRQSSQSVVRTAPQSTSRSCRT